MRAAPHQPLSSLLPLAPAGGGGLDSDSDIRSFLHLMCGRSEYGRFPLMLWSDEMCGRRKCFPHCDGWGKRKIELGENAVSTVGKTPRNNAWDIRKLHLHGGENACEAWGKRIRNVDTNWGKRIYMMGKTQNQSWGKRSGEHRIGHGENARESTE